jgi:hypothetical protein
MPHLTPIQTARAIANLEENWSLAAVARELHCSKTYIFNIKRRWQENRLERQIRMCWKGFFTKVYFHFNNVLITSQPSYPTSTRRHGNFAGVHTLLRILLSSNSAVLINIITGVSPPHFDFVVYYVLCQC